MNKNNNTDFSDDLEKLKKAWEALKREEDKHRGRNTRPIKAVSPAPNRVFETVNMNKPKGSLIGRILRRMKYNYDHRFLPREEVNDFGLTTDDVVAMAAKMTHMSNPDYQRRVANQQLADQIAANQEALTERVISQGMTWLYPRFEDKLEEIIKEIQKK